MRQSVQRKSRLDFNRNPRGINQWTGIPYRCARHPGAPRTPKSNGKPGQCAECGKITRRKRLRRLRKNS